MFFRCLSSKAIVRVPISKGMINNQDNSGTVGVDVGFGEVDGSGMFIVCVLLQLLVSSKATAS
jgi:hypothetical protein